MSLLFPVVVLLLLPLFVAGGFYFGGPVVGGCGTTLILVMSLVAFFLGGFDEIFHSATRIRLLSAFRETGRTVDAEKSDLITADYPKPVGGNDDDLDYLTAD
jgi:hypothetical protein